VIPLAEKEFSGAKPVVSFMLEISAWLNEQEGKPFNTVRVSLYAAEGKLSPRMARKLLRESTERGKDSWEKYGYAFDFKNGSYRRNGKAIHVTAGEAWFLYKWLVLGRPATAAAFEIQHLRQRLGPGFLREVTGGKRSA
jgi:hypothetical protein